MPRMRCADKLSITRIFSTGQPHLRLPSDIAARYFRCGPSLTKTRGCETVMEYCRVHKIGRDGSRPPAIRKIRKNVQLDSCVSAGSSSASEPIPDQIVHLPTRRN